MALPSCLLVFVGGRHSQCPRPSSTLGHFGPSHQQHHKSRVSLKGPPCAHGVWGIPHGELHDIFALYFNQLCKEPKHSTNTWRKTSYKIYLHYQICEGSPSHVPLPALKSTWRVSNVHKVSSNNTQLLSMSHNHVQHKQAFCLNTHIFIEYFTYSFCHLNHMRLRFVIGYMLLPPILVLTT